MGQLLGAWSLSSEVVLPLPPPREGISTAHCLPSSDQISNGFLLLTLVLLLLPLTAWGGGWVMWGGEGVGEGPPSATALGSLWEPGCGSGEGQGQIHAM